MDEVEDYGQEVDDEDNNEESEAEEEEPEEENTPEGLAQIIFETLHNFSCGLVYAPSSAMVVYILSLSIERKAPVSEFEIMQEKLKKAKMAMARGFLQRKQAVDRNIARR